MTEPRLWCAAILVMLVLGLATSAGCIGGPDTVADRDIVVLKLTPDGALQWTRTIDTGQDDGAEDLVELPDGGFAIAAQNGSDPRYPARPRFVRLSPDGTVAWDLFVTDGSDIARAVVPDGDGGTAVLTGNGTVVRYDPAGRALWARPTGIVEAQTIRQTADGGYVVGGRITYHVSTNVTVPPAPGGVGPGAGSQGLAQPADPSATSTPLTAIVYAGEEGMVTRLASDGAIIWERQYDEGGPKGIQSIAESPDRTGFLLTGDGTPPNGSPSNPLLALRLDPDGTPGTVTQLDTAAFTGPAGIRADPPGVSGAVPEC